MDSAIVRDFAEVSDIMAGRQLVTVYLSFEDDRPLVFEAGGRSLFPISNIKRQQIVICQVSMSKGLVRLRIREFADQNGWTLKEVSDRSGVGYSTIRNYAQCQGMTTVNFAYLHRLARIFDIMIEDLVEILEE